MMSVVGIDPGLTGGVAHIRNGVLLGVHDMPVHDHMVDARGLHRLLQHLDPDLVVVEQVHAMPKNGSKAAFSLGDSLAVVRTICAIERYRMERVLPVMWKRRFSLLKKDKDASRRLASEMFPHFEQLFKRVRDDGRAEAALIAQYGWSSYLPHTKEQETA